VRSHVDAAQPQHASQSPTQRTYLHANACLPFVVMIVCLGVVGDIVLAVFVFQILCMIILPLM